MIKRIIMLLKASLLHAPRNTFVLCTYILLNHVATDKEENADKERVHVTAAQVSEVCTVCNPKSSPADEEFRVLVKEGSA
jgi:hypothetical protein